MKSSYRSERPRFSSIEPLEARVAPATVSATFLNGILKINALSPLTAAQVSIFQQGTDADVFSVTDSGNINLGTFDGVKSIQATLTDGNDFILIGLPNTSIYRGSVIINTLGGQDGINLSSGIFQGAVTLNSTAMGLINIGNQTQIRGPLKVASGGGGLDLYGKAETIATNNLGAVILHEFSDIKGSLAISTSILNPGGQTVLTSEHGTFIRRALTFTNKRTTNSIINLSGQVSGKASFVFGASANSILATSNARLFGGLSVKGGIGPETITVNGPDIFTTTVAAGMALNLGDGNNSVTLNNTRVAGSVRVVGGVGDDAVTVNSTYIGGALQTALGTNATATGNVVNINNFSSIFGATQITGSTGKDSVNTSGSSAVGPARIALGAGANSINALSTNFESGLAYSGLGDADSVLIVGGAVRGTLSVSTGDGSNTVGLQGANVHGKAMFKGGNIGSDSFTVDLNTLINGSLTINAGNGSNITVIQNFGSTTGFVYNGGSDSDLVALSQQGPGPADAGSYVRGRVKLGDGTDTVNFLLTSYIAFSIDGGLGADTLNQNAATSIFGRTLTGIESIITLP